MNISSKNFTSIEQITDQYLKKKANTSVQQNKEKLSFKDILDDNLKFSKHATERLESRNIDLTREQLERLEDGTNKAREKGIDESLVLVDNLAFIVSTKNNTVITALNDKEDRIFTNIEGAVIV
ncbi:putative flagellar hook associated protein [Lachnospiraceae bacterium KM106-2]|nr:putative flagellar hook associated protein [Lachnospiraceae bacterium KM106-2]